MLWSSLVKTLTMSQGLHIILLVFSKFFHFNFVYIFLHLNPRINKKGNKWYIYFSMKKHLPKNILKIISSWNDFLIVRLSKGTLCLVINHAELCISCFFTDPTTKVAEIGNVLSSQQFLHRFRNRNPHFQRFRRSFSMFTSKGILKLVRVSASLFRLVGVKYRPKSDDPGSMSL